MCIPRCYYSAQHNGSFRQERRTTCICMRMYVRSHVQSRGFPTPQTRGSFGEPCDRPIQRLPPEICKQRPLPMKQVKRQSKTQTENGYLPVSGVELPIMLSKLMNQFQVAPHKQALDVPSNPPTRENLRASPPQTSRTPRLGALSRCFIDILLSHITPSPMPQPTSTAAATKMPPTPTPHCLLAAVIALYTSTEYRSISRSSLCSVHWHQAILGQRTFLLGGTSVRLSCR